MIAGRYMDDGAIEVARLTLAECILAVAGQNETDVGRIIRLALPMFRSAERRLQP